MNIKDFTFRAVWVKNIDLEVEERISINMQSFWTKTCANVMTAFKKNYYESSNTHVFHSIFPNCLPQTITKCSSRAKRVPEGNAFDSRYGEPSSSLPWLSELRRFNDEFWNVLYLGLSAPVYMYMLAVWSCVLTILGRLDVNLSKTFFTEQSDTGSKPHCESKRQSESRCVWVKKERKCSSLNHETKVKELISFIGTFFCKNGIKIRMNVYFGYPIYLFYNLV